ncbi:18053_t:CDS:2, partial [Cetraspora pellucida]
VICQEFYLLLEVKKKNAFADLPENLYSAIENLDCSCNIHETIVYNDDPQVDNQEISIKIIDSNENQNINIVNLNKNQDINIDVNNQDIILIDAIAYRY